MSLYERPRLVSVYGLGIISAICFSVAWIWSESPALFTVGVAMGGVSALVGLAGLWNWWSWRANEYYEKRRQSEILTPFSLVLGRAAALTPEQTAIVPKLDYEAEVLVTVGAQGDLGFMLATHGGAIPYEWIGIYLQKCTGEYVYPINRYNDKTSGRIFATALMTWLVEHRYALPAHGKFTYAWMTERSKDQLIRQLRLHELLAFSHYTVEDRDGRIGAFDGRDERGDAVV